MRSILTFVALAIALAGCGYHTQSSSGESYLAQYVGTPASAPAEGSFEETLRDVAAVEPVLRFPAQIGIAKLDREKWGGVKLGAISSLEAEAWTKIAQSLGSDFGSFQPVEPLVARMVSESINHGSRRGSDDVIDEIRLGAARQHLDAVLIYETVTKSEIERNLLAVTDVTIIGGAFFPSRNVNSTGFARAMLIDVLQGYPYGTATATVEDDGISTWWFSGDREEALSKEVKVQAAVALAPEVEKLFRQVRTDLTAKRLAMK